MATEFILEVAVHKYNNPTHAAISPAEGEAVCCDDFAIPANCLDPCDNVFTFCLREMGRTDENALNLSNCPYGLIKTGVFENNDNLTFTLGEDLPGGIPNPLLFSGPSWPVRLII